MTLCHLLLAYWYLSAEDAGVLPEVFAVIGLRADALREVAIHLEVMDPREASWLLANDGHLAADGPTLRQRYLELLDAPPLADAHRLPAREELAVLLGQSRAYQRRLEEQLELWSWRTDLHDALCEAQYRYQVYDLMRDAVSPWYYVAERRRALARLRELVGPEVYYTAAWPEHVPRETFRVIE